VEYQVRAARITDVDRLVALSHEAVFVADRGDTRIAPDLLRQLVYLPQASIFVAERGRELAGGAVLALRPSVRAGGYVGTVDLFMVDPQHDIDLVTEALIEELLRSARNKGCTVVEAVRPEDPEDRDRWNRLGFTSAEPQLMRPVAEPAAAPH
jgi:GNAT superfamily N-acetyltransferase